LGSSREHKPDEAIPHYLEAIRLRPRFIGGHTNLALALAELGRVDEAIVQFEEALRLEPKNHLVNLHLGFCVVAQRPFGRRGFAVQGGDSLKPTTSKLTMGLASC
jgi:tetratricopeptide (TPR) repeat protein